jgi:hypothetical protein
MNLWTSESQQIRKIKHLASNDAHKDLELAQRDETQTALHGVHRIAKSIRNIYADKQKDTITGVSGIKPLKYCSGTIKSIHKIIKSCSLWSMINKKLEAAKLAKMEYTPIKVCLG